MSANTNQSCSDSSAPVIREWIATVSVLIKSLNPALQRHYLTNRLNVILAVIKDVQILVSNPFIYGNIGHHGSYRLFRIMKIACRLFLQAANGSDAHYSNELFNELRLKSPHDLSLTRYLSPKQS